MLLGGALLAYATFGAPSPASASMQTAREMQTARDIGKRVHDATEAGCLHALTPDHRVSVFAIIARFNNGDISYDAAGAAIAALLTGSEIHAIGAQHQLMIDTFHAQMHPNAPTPDPHRPPFPFGRAQAGAFLVTTLGDPGRVSSATSNMPMPSVAPH